MKHLAMSLCCKLDFFHAQLEKIPGILIFRFLAPLCFLSSPAFRKRLELAAQIEKIHWNKEKGGCLKTLFLKVICNGM